MILGSSNLWTGLFIAPVGAGFTRSPITEIYGPPLHPALPSLPPSLSLSRRGILFFFFLFHNEQKRGRRIRASLRSDPSRDPRVLFDGTLRRFQSISRRNSRGQKETRSSSTTIHTDCPRQSCVFTRARMRMRILSFQIFAHQTLFSLSPPSASADQDENRWRTGRGKKLLLGKKLFPHLEREFFQQPAFS